MSRENGGGSRTPGPPLPPRQQHPSSNFVGIKEKTAPRIPMHVDEELLSAVARHDTRLLSEQTVQPTAQQQQHRRKLLLVFVHGFMGDETSFQGFPAHVHNVLSLLLEESHVVNTKIYPRYRSRRNISFARDDFSRWLEPHENEGTDIVLLGHSMGGLLTADVALKPNDPPYSQTLKHGILGTINFDVPFLGLHPGIIKSGLASIFRPADENHQSDETTTQSNITTTDEPGSSSSSAVISPPENPNSFWSHNDSDPNFNPSFTNDVILPVRKGWRNALHFISKHRGDLPRATKQLVSSHLEFGVAMANYSELKFRYAKIRALEEDDEKSRRSVVGNKALPSRVRFINYYTVCTGRPKKPVSPEETQEGTEEFETEPLNSNEKISEQGSTNVDEGSQLEPSAAGSSTILIPGEEQLQDAMETLTIDVNHPSTKQEPVITDTATDTIESPSLAASEVETNDVEKLEKHEDASAATPETEVENASAKRTDSDTSSAFSRKTSTDRPRKERTFCVLPPTDSQGVRDPCWVRVFMENVDEVGAHCGLFFADEKYERLVGDVASRIEVWVQESMDLRLSALIGS